MADEQIRQRAFRAVLKNALLSWQVAFTVIFTIILYVGADISETISMWQQWFWLIGGAAAVGSFVLATATDPQATQDAISREFERQYDLTRIRNPIARKHMKDALEYRRNMLALAKRGRGSLRTSLLHTVEDVNDWLGHMYDLALHIDAFESNDLVERDRRAVPQQIEKTRARLEVERDPDVKADLERKISQLEQQLANLDATVSSVKRAEIQLESTLASLGTVYAQMTRLGTKEVDSARTQRLRLEIQDEVSSLQDTIEAMDEVQAQTLGLR